MDENQLQAPNWQDEAMADARRIGDLLKNKYNMQPSKYPGTKEVMPAPGYHSISLKDLGKDHMVL